jgi:hypothetical protein
MLLHGCCPVSQSFRAMQGLEGGPGSGPRPRHPTIDFHCHVLTLAAEPLVADCPQKKNEPASMLKAMGEASITTMR